MPHRLALPSSGLVGLLLCTTGATACASPDPIEVRLVHSRSLSPEDAFERLELRVVEEETGRLVRSGSTPAGLDGRTELFDADALEHGRRYRLELVAQAPGVCRLGRAVGRSLPFEHREGAYSVSVQVGCADEMAPVLGRPTASRIGHRLVTAADGRAVLVGGARRQQVEPPAGTFGFEPADLVPVVERYATDSGRFVPAGNLVVPRHTPAVVALADGAVGVVGGHLGAWPSCESSIERVAGLSTAVTGTLMHPRCFASAAAVPGADRVLVTGYPGEGPIPNGELWDGPLRAGLGTFAGAVPRFSTAMIPLSDGESALLVGGSIAAAPVPVVERARVSGDVVLFDGAAMEEAPTGGYHNQAVVRLDCPLGGGTVWILGGYTGEDATGRALDQVWCYRDVPGATGTVVRAGRLPGKRALAEAVAVPGPGGRARILLVGGTPNDAETAALPHEDALIVPADACECAAVDPMEVRSIPIPVDGLMILHAVTALPDGSALIVGGVEPTLDGWLRATGEAALFVPDLP